MTLPTLTLPIAVPFEISLSLYAIVVHLAIALPMVVLLVELLNLFLKRRLLSVVSFLLWVIVTITMVVWYGGTIQHSELLQTLLKGSDLTFETYNQIGIYLVYSALFLAILKFIFIFFSRVITQLMFMILLGGFIAGTLYHDSINYSIVSALESNKKALSEVNASKVECSEQFELLESKYESLQQEHNMLLQESNRSTEKLNQVEKLFEGMQEQIDKAIDEAIQNSINKNLEII